MRKYNIIVISLFVTSTIGILFYFAINHIDIKEKSYKLEVVGSIDKIKTNVKGEPTIWVKQKSYPLPFATSNELNVGDSIVKLKNTHNVYQYRKGEIIDTFSW